MKQTGVVRKIDELGRIVLPKEIRRNLGIRDGESLEIFVDERGVYLQKFSRIQDLKELGKEFCKDILEYFKIDLFVLDRDKVVAGSDANIMGLKVSNNINELMDNRDSYKSLVPEGLFNEELIGYFMMKPIIIASDCIGMLVLFKKEQFNLFEEKLLDYLVYQFVKQIDIE